MLTNEWMGAFCLGVVWLNTLLIVGHVLQARSALAREAAALGTVVRAKVVGSAPVGVVNVTQVGRAITTGGPERILFTEASRAVEVREGEVEIGGDRVRLLPAKDARAWPVASAGTRVENEFAPAYRAASTNRGLTSVLVVPIGGADVWLAGEREGDTFRVRVVSDRDPAAELASGRRRAVLFALAALAVLGGITALALVRPWFSGWSTLGGALAVAYFLAVQPLAVALREAIAAPDQRRIGGEWAA